MKFCQPHWDALRAAIDLRGLWPLVSPTPELATARAALLADGDALPEDFDPLMGAYFSIAAWFVQGYGVAQASTASCPCCAVESTDDGLSANWISGAADEQLKRARDLKLAPVLH